MWFLLKYFAILGVLIGIINTFYVHKKINLNSLEKQEADEVKKFILLYGFCFSAPFLFIQIFQIAGNYSTIFFIFSLDFNNTFYILSFISIVLFLGMLFYLIILK
jgi:hypothetical protein